MGEVYRAEDSRLGREVAVKVLPAAFVADAERLVRFEREARTLASLSHPNIASIHEVGREDGTHFLVMELARGETLADRIARGPLPLGEALPIALQIAEALEAAHERGVVHRDLKPANVMVDPEGRVKVLDFGLAKALGADVEGGGLELAQSPTLTMQATRIGVLLGTAAYMSPEQAAGRPADRRADVWAFGALLFEMLAATPPFGGETISHVLAAVLKDEPPWQALPSGLSPRLRHLLERCLRKSPRHRLQAIGDARLVVEEVLAQPELDAAPAAAGDEPARGRLAWLPWSVAAAATLGLLALAVARLTTPEVEDLRFEVALPPGTVLALDHQNDAIAISRDGRRQALLVHGSEGPPHLVLRELGELRAQVLPGTEEASSPFFSPDGEWIAFFSRNRLWKMPIGGGPPSLVADAPGDNRGATWGDDGFIYAVRDTSLPLQRVSERGGTLEDVTTLDGERRERTHRWPEALPGGAVLFSSDTFDSIEFYDDSRIEAVRPETGERKVLVEQSSRARYLASGELVFARGGALFAVPFDIDALEVRGKPTVVLQGVATTMASGAAHFALARMGTLMYVPGAISGGDSSPVWIDRATGAQQPSGVAAGRIDKLALSPDGQRAALIIGDNGSADLWVADLGSGNSTRLTFTGTALDPAWSPDGRWIAFQGAGGIYRQRADGGGEPELLLERGTSRVLLPNGFTADGAALVVEHSGPGGLSDLSLLTIGGGAAPTPLVTTPETDTAGVVSPDGRWLAYVSLQNGHPMVYARRVSPGGGRWQIADRAWEPRWSPDGRDLFFRGGAGDLFVVAVEIGDTLRVGAPRRIAGGLRAGDNSPSYGVTADGSRLLALGSTSIQEADRLHLILDWQRELRRITRPSR